MGRDHVKVCVRTRPTSTFAQDAIVIDKEAQTITVNHGTLEQEAEIAATGMHDNRQNSFRFQFHHVLHNAGQDTIYDGLARDVVQGAVDGISGCIMTYGQTGSGKTFTMSGDSGNYQHRGISPRALTHVFQEVNARIETAFSVNITYMEIYNEKIFDLLVDPAVNATKGDYTIAEDRAGRGVFVRGLTEVEVKSEQEALNLLYGGELMRTTAQHNLNKKSNRSHSIFTVYVTQRAKSGVSEKVVSSKLNLVDLAGSERLKKALDQERLEGRTVSDETIKKESMYINQSLSYLEQCVVALSRRNAGHVPYRQSKLTNVLKDSLGGNCNTLLLACIWGEAQHLEETMSTLRLASRMMRVQNETHALEVLDPMQTLKKQERTIRDLKQELLMHDALADRSRVVYDPYTPEQQQGIRRQLEKFVAAQGPEEEEASFPPLESVRQMREICRVFKTLILEVQGDARSALLNSAGGMGEGGLATPEDGDTREGVEGGNPNKMQGTADTLVGSMEPDNGFGLGRAPDHARPVTVDSTRDRPLSRQQQGGRGGASSAFMAGAPPAGQSEPKDGLLSPVLSASEVGDDGPSATKRHFGRSRVGGGAGGGVQAPASGTTFNDRSLLAGGAGGGPSGGRWGGGGGVVGEAKSAMYEAFKQGVGRQLNGELLATKALAKAQKEGVREQAARVNALKKQIDQLQATVRDKRLKRPSLPDVKGTADDVMDEDEFKLVTQERETKRNYKEAFEVLAKAKAKMEASAQQEEELRKDLIQSFDGYLEEKAEGGFEEDGLDIDSRAPLSPGGGIRWDEGGFEDTGSLEQAALTRVADKDQNSLAFFQAQKTRIATRNQNTLALKQAHRSKRNR
ncbi:kinesin-like protein [Ectocarpus siliculosus]|uniref:Kinesin-like protein n=1 Tax=Ectocarpus siliculosus TaxID=2880 RepID=D8LC74_ECTSI|nr:kinesin-like protein [Ectocarpus siliculosus]|eukprot:CBN79257.1 kinesin-like protein [Ectocarpus siliculosus]